RNDKRSRNQQSSTHGGGQDEKQACVHYWRLSAFATSTAARRPLHSSRFKRKTPLMSSQPVCQILTRLSSSSSQTTGRSLMRYPCFSARTSSSVSKNQDWSAIWG